MKQYRHLIALCCLIWLLVAYQLINAFAASLSGTNVAAPIVPFTDTDIYPTHDARYGKGGYVQFQYSTQCLRQVSTFRRYTGMFCFAVDANKDYRYAGLGIWKEVRFRGYSGAKGLRGYDGRDGTNGTNGTNGAAGSQIYTAIGAPLAGTGVNSDWYLNTSNGDYYLKGSGTWTLKGNLTGPQGPPGPAATVDQPAVLAALATLGGNPTTRQPLAPQTNSSALWQLRNLVGNVTVFASGDGTFSFQDINGYIRIKINPTTWALEMRDAANKLRWQKTSDGGLTQYHSDGVTPGFRVYSGGQVTL